MRQVVLDTETTGLSWEKGNRVVEIGCLELIERRPTGRTFQRYLNPDRDMEPGAQEVTGLTREFLSDKPRFAEVVDEFLDFIRGAELVIHNAAFDVGFIDAELRRTGRPGLREHAARITDSLLLAREMFPGKANSLDALCRRLEVDNTHRTLHGALLDAGLLAEVYIRMTRGQDALAMDTAAAAAAAGIGNALAPIDLRGLVLAVVEPTADELAAHESVLADLDKASGGKTVWRTLAA